MPDVDTDKTTVYPSENDIAVTKGEGGIGTEDNVSNQEQFQHPKNGIIADRDSDDQQLSTAGFIASEVGSSLNLKIDVGVGSPSKAEAFVDGYIMKFTGVLKTGAADFLMTASQTNHVYLKIKKTAGKVVGAEIVIDPRAAGVAPDPPTEFTKIAKVITDGSEITDVIDERSAMISLPIRLKTFSATVATTSFVSKFTEFIYIPIIGRLTTLKIAIKATSNVGVPTPPGLVARIKVTGPEGSTTGSDFTTPDLPPGDNIDLIIPSVNINNNTGRYNDSFGVNTSVLRGGIMKVEIEAKLTGLGGGVPSFTLENTGFEACARFMEWNAPL